MRAAAADDSRIDEGIAESRAFGHMGGIVAEGLRTHCRIVGDAAQEIVLQVIMFEVARTEPRALFEHHDAEAGLR